MYRLYMKRVVDFLLALVALLVFSPLLLGISALVWIKLGRPVLYKARRPGYNERIFTLLKFRTMSNAKDETGELLPDNVRLTKFGRTLRSTSLDELPELLNILKGDMSIVGPRPLAEDYLPHYTEEERKRHDVRPGLTGLAQVSGRNSLSWEEKFAYDIEYVNKMSFWMDIKIIFTTIIKVFKKSDIGERGGDGLIDFDEYRQQKLHNSKE